MSWSSKRSGSRTRSAKEPSVQRDRCSSSTFRAHTVSAGRAKNAGRSRLMHSTRNRENSCGKSRTDRAGTKGDVCGGGPRARLFWALIYLTQ
jgi:hypothetical protein